MSGVVSGQTEVPNTFQSGQPAKASEVNENFDAVVQGVQSLEASAQDTAADDASQFASLNGLLYRISELEEAVNLLGQDAAVCSVRNPSACNALLGQKDLVLLSPILSLDVYFVMDPVASNSVFARPYEKGINLPNDTSDDTVKLVFGRQANFTRGAGSSVNAEVLVDSCDNPTVYLVPTGEAKTGGLGVDNGMVYRDDSEASPITVNVTGGTYGLIHDFVRYVPSGDVTPPAPPGSPPQLCSSVSDRVGLYDSYPLILWEDTSTWGAEWSLTADELPLGP